MQNLFKKNKLLDFGKNEFEDHDKSETLEFSGKIELSTF